MTLDKYVSFDLEIYKEIPEGVDDWKTIRPLGITCAATWASDEPKGRAWYAGKANMCKDEFRVMINDMTKTGCPPLSRKMHTEEALHLVYYLRSKHKDGYKIVTWNGLSFDFDVLAEESKYPETCANLALNHVDLMFQFLCMTGYPVGLNYVAMEMLGATKTEGMSGALAPKMWQGSQDDRLKTIEYVLQDAKLTLDLTLAIENAGYLAWITKQGAGRKKTIKFDRLLSCRDALMLDKPDTSWMTTPIKRESFYEWVGEALL